MTTQGKSLQDAITALNLASDVNAQATYHTVGLMPNSLAGHLEKKTYVILGMTPEEFITKHGATSFNMNELVKKFKTICKDFEEDLILDVASKAVEFCSRIIYEVGPEARQVKKANGDKTWKFIFTYKENGRLVCKAAFVSTFKEDNNVYTLECTADKISLSVKNASLLAIMTLARLNEISLATSPNDGFLLTPLAGAIFSRDDIPKMCIAMNMSGLSMIRKINSSCQSGGHYLDESNVSIAAIAAIVATRNIKDKKVREGIIGKTVKQYLNVKKQWDTATFETMAPFGHGGVPSNISPDTLINTFDNLQKIAPLSATRAARQTQMSSSIVAPSGAFYQPRLQSYKSSVPMPTSLGETTLRAQSAEEVPAPRTVGECDGNFKEWMTTKGVMIDGKVRVKINMDQRHPEYNTVARQAVSEFLDEQWAEYMAGSTSTSEVDGGEGDEF